MTLSGLRCYYNEETGAWEALEDVVPEDIVFTAEATNTGNWSAAKVNGKQSVAVATGYQSKACGALGCWLVLSEWRDGEIVDMQLTRVDGEKIKADTWYMLQGGSFVEVEEEK